MLVNRVKHCPNADCAGLARDRVIAEFVEALEECIDCGTRLVPGPGVINSEIGLEFNPLKTVFIAANGTEGHVVAGTIEAEGIPVYIKGEMLLGGVGELPTLDVQVEIQVPAERAEQAREIAMRFEGRRGEE
jgi:hypothetical protein